MQATGHTVRRVLTDVNRHETWKIKQAGRKDFGANDYHDDEQSGDEWPFVSKQNYKRQR